MAIIHILHIITIMSFISIISIILACDIFRHECLCLTARNVLPGVSDEDILLGYDAETPQLNIEAVSHAVDRLRYYYLF